MNKKLLIAALLASSTAFASKFTIDSKHEIKKLKDVKWSSIKNEINVGLEHTLGKSGITLGGNFKFDNDLFKNHEERKLKELNANIKYDSPELIDGLTSSIKGNIKIAGKVKEEIKPELSGEFGIAYKKDDMKYQLNSKTVFMPKDLKANFEHQLKAENKNIKAEAKVKHDNKKVFVGLGLDGSKKISEKTTLMISDKFGIVKANNKSDAKEKIKSTILGEEKLNKSLDLKNDFNLGFKYSNNDLEITATTLLENSRTSGDEKARKKEKRYRKFLTILTNTLGANQKLYERIARNKKNMDSEIILSKKDILDTLYKQTQLIEKAAFEASTKHKLGFGEKIAVKYKGIKNLELSSSALFAGIYTFENQNLEGLVALDAKAKYKLELTNNLNLIPSLEGNVKFSELRYGEAVEKITGSITPKVAIEYKASNDLTLKAQVETKSSFDSFIDPYYGPYTGTSLKATTGLEYKW